MSTTTPTRTCRLVSPQYGTSIKMSGALTLSNSVQSKHLQSKDSCVSAISWQKCSHLQRISPQLRPTFWPNILTRPGVTVSWVTHSEFVWCWFTSTIVREESFLFHKHVWHFELAKKKYTNGRVTFWANTCYSNIIPWMSKIWCLCPFFIFWLLNVQLSLLAFSLVYIPIANPVQYSMRDYILCIYVNVFMKLWLFSCQFGSAVYYIYYVIRDKIAMSLFVHY